MTTLTLVLFCVCINISCFSSAELLTAIRGESFTMLCYKDISGVEIDYVELLYTSNSDGAVEQSIGRYNPTNGQAVQISSQFQGRLTFTPKYNITIKNIQVDDEGKYECVSRGLYVPSGEKKSNELEVYVRPVVEAVLTNSPLQAGSGLINAASCSALNGKPAATVTWSTEKYLQFNQTQSTTEGDESETITSASTLYVAPTEFYNKQTFLCRIDHPALPNGYNVSSIILDVQYPPTVPRIQVINKNTQLNCTADGNPTPTLQWTMPNNHPSPNPARGSSTIWLKSPDDPARQNDTYVCTASNGLSPSTKSNITTADAVTYVAFVKQSNTGVIIGAVVGSILILLCIAALVYWFFIRKHREKDSGPYRAPKSQSEESGWGGSSSGRPTIQHANESLNKNAPPSPTRPPPEDDDEGSNYSQSDVEEFTGDDVDINSPLTGPDDNDMEVTGIVSKNSVNFQHRRQRPSTSPHRRSQNRSQPQPTARMPQQSDPHYEVPPKEYYEDEYEDDHHLMSAQHHPEEDDRFYDRPEDRYPGYQPRYDEPPQHDDHLPPYSDTIQYASLDHAYNSGKPRTRPPYHEPVEYAEIRSKGQIV